jgi:hypothetical protein
MDKWKTYLVEFPPFSVSSLNRITMSLRGLPEQALNLSADRGDSFPASLKSVCFFRILYDHMNPISSTFVTYSNVSGSLRSEKKDQEA